MSADKSETCCISGLIVVLGALLDRSTEPSLLKALRARLPSKRTSVTGVIRFWPTLLRLSCAQSFTAALAVALLLAMLGQSKAADPTAKRILMLHSFGPRFKPWSDYEQAIRSEISRRWQKRVEFLDQSLVNAGDGENPEPAFVDYLRALYARRPIDLIVAMGAPAADFIQRHRQQLFPTTPMVFTAVEQRRVQSEKLTENDTVVAVAHDFPAAFDNILRVLPLTQTIAVVNGASPNEKFWLKEMRRELAPLTRRIELRWYDELSFEDILLEAARLPPHSAIFWHLMNVDAAGVSHEANDALNKLSSSANAPVFSYDGSFFGEAIVGGPMHSVQQLSQSTADVAVRILNGEKPGDIKTPPSPFAAPIFDWRQLQRWGISDSNLPAGSTLYFRELTGWERYSWQIALTAAVILAQAAFISALLHANRRRQFAEMQSRERLTELARVVRFSTAGELTASIAHEINQPLGAILTNAGKVDDANEAFAKAIQADPTKAEAYYQKGVNLLGKATIKDGKMVAPPEASDDLQKYLELQPTGTYAQASKDMLGTLGGSVDLKYQNPDAPKKKKK